MENNIKVNKISDDVYRKLIALACMAGRAVVEVRLQSGLGGMRAQLKADSSPVTKADILADTMIREGLFDIMPDIPVLSEESIDSGIRPSQSKIGDGFGMYFLVDPIDGTREFVSGLNEFTINIAIIEQRVPVFGVVYAPALNELFWGGIGHPGKTLKVSPEVSTEEIISQLTDACLMTTASVNQPLSAVTSRSHGSPRTDRMLDLLKIDDVIFAGSSLKFCRVAQGKAHIYPRIGPTMLWDTAAGEAVLASVGGSVFDLEGKPLVYDPTESTLKNPSFLAVCHEEIAERVLISAQSAAQ